MALAEQTATGARRGRCHSLALMTPPDTAPRPPAGNVGFSQHRTQRSAHDRSRWLAAPHSSHHGVLRNRWRYVSASGRSLLMISRFQRLWAIGLSRKFARRSSRYRRGLPSRRSVTSGRRDAAITPWRLNNRIRNATPTASTAIAQQQRHLRRPTGGQPALRPAPSKANDMPVQLCGQRRIISAAHRRPRDHYH